MVGVVRSYTVSPPMVSAEKWDSTHAVMELDELPPPGPPPLAPPTHVVVDVALLDVTLEGGQAQVSTLVD